MKVNDRVLILNNFVTRHGVAINSVATVIEILAATNKGQAIKIRSDDGAVHTVHSSEVRKYTGI